MNLKCFEIFIPILILTDNEQIKFKDEIITLIILTSLEE
jgi:hypothetical protein